MPNLFGFLASIGYPVSHDLLLLLGMGVVAVIYGLTLGRDRSIVALFALYFSYILTLHLPLVARLNQWLRIPPSPTLSALWFAAFFVICFLVLRRVPHVQDLPKETGSWWEAVFLAILQVGLAVCLVAHLLPASLITGWSPRLTLIFLSEWGQSFWLLAPFLFTAFVKPPYGGYTADLSI